MAIDVNRVYRTIGEAAAAAGVSRTVVQRRVARGDLPVTKKQGPRGGRPSYNIHGADLAACFPDKARIPMETGAPQVPPSPDLEDAVITAMAAAETLPPPPAAAPPGIHVALLKNPQLAEPPGTNNPDPARSPGPRDFPRTRPSRANAGNITPRGRAERVHNFIAARGTELFIVDTLEKFLPLLCRKEGLTGYEGEMWMIETCCGGEAADEFDGMYGDPKPRGKGFWGWVTG